MTGRHWAVATLAFLPLLAVLNVASAASLTLSSQKLTTYRTCTITATPSSTTGVIDANIRQGSPNTNFGTATTLATSSSNNANQRLYIQFDLTRCSPSIASAAIVRLATLRLHLTALPGACRTIDIFRVGTSWTEAGITWNNQPFGTSINNPASASRTDSFNAGTPAGCENLATGAYSTGAVVTSDVAAFLAGTTNVGWMLRDDVEGSSPARTTTFSSKDAGVVAQAPQLVITYVTVP